MAVFGLGIKGFFKGFRKSLNSWAKAQPKLRQSEEKMPGQLPLTCLFQRAQGGTVENGVLKHGTFRNLGYLILGVLIIRILLFTVLY